MRFVVSWEVLEILRTTYVTKVGDRLTKAIRVLDIIVSYSGNLPKSVRVE